MRRLNKELLNRGIIGCADEYDIVVHNSIDWSNVLVSFDNKFLVVARFSQVLDPTLVIYDAKTLEPIGEQLLNKEDSQLSFCACFNPWESYLYESNIDSPFDGIEYEDTF